MTKVAVIGNAGGGKSTFARQLGGMLGLPYFAIDQIQWKPGWVVAEDLEYTEQHDRMLEQTKWIIDGFGSWDSIYQRFEMADTLILIDHPLWVHYWWATKRQIKCIFSGRPDGPEGCPMLPITFKLYKMIWKIHNEATPRLLELLDNYKGSKSVYHIRSKKDMRLFLQNLR